MTKFLGVWIDSNLNWTEHINKIVLKLKSRLSLLRCSKNFLNPHCMKVLYYAQVHSNLSYCLSMGGNMISQTQKNKLKKIQNQCIATIDKNLTTTATYKHYKILTFEDLISHETNKLWHKRHLNLLPTPLTKNMKTDITGLTLVKKHRYNTRNRMYLNHPCAITDSYRKSFLAKGLQCYNELPLQIRESGNIANFSRACKDYLLDKM